MRMFSLKHKQRELLFDIFVQGKGHILSSIRLGLWFKINILFIILAMFILKLRYIQKQKQTKNLLGTLIPVFTLCNKEKKMSQWRAAGST